MFLVKAEMSNTTSLQLAVASLCDVSTLLALREEGANGFTCVGGDSGGGSVRLLVGRGGLCCG